MIFCDCGKIMEIKDDGLRIAVCSCGNKKLLRPDDSLNIEEKQPEKEIRSSEVVSQKHELGGFPHICSKCGHNQADVIDLGIFYSDEAAVYLFRCKKCGHSERQADGTGN